MKNQHRLKKWLRLQHGRTSNLARELGTTRMSLFHWTSGRSLPSLVNQLAIDTATKGKVPISGWPPSRPNGRPRGS